MLQIYIRYINAFIFVVSFQLGWEKFKCCYFIEVKKYILVMSRNIYKNNIQNFWMWVTHTVGNYIVNYLLLVNIQLAVAHYMVKHCNLCSCSAHKSFVLLIQVFTSKCSTRISFLCCLLIWISLPLILLNIAYLTFSAF